MTAGVVGAARPDASRPVLTISAWNALSRLTGFIRVLAVGGALGTTFLGNTYQSSNLVSTVLFELLAAGLLSAPLVPVFVGLLDRGGREDAERLAGTLLGMSLVGLGTLMVALMATRHGVMRLLTVGVEDAAVRAAEVRLGAFLLWFFLPQLLLYAVGAVASALLNAERRFAAAAFAPVANNLVVTATMGAFVVVSSGHRGLEPTLSARLVLAAGTTAGVLAMTAVPVVALARSGTRLRPRLDRGSPHLAAVARLGGWGAVLLAGSQVLVGVTMVLANRVEGGVVAYQIAFTFFLLPVALVAHPIFTAMYPALASHAHGGRWEDFAGDLAAAVRRTVLLVVPAAALLAALGAPLLALVRFGALESSGARLVARVVSAYALGLGGYAVFQLLARAATAAGHPRAPAVVGLAMAGGGAVGMVAAAGSVSGTDEVVALGVAHSVAVTAGALALGLVLARRLPLRLAVGADVGRAVAAGAACWGVATVVGRMVGGEGRLGAALDVVAAGSVGLLAGVGVLWALRTPELVRTPTASGPAGRDER